MIGIDSLKEAGMLENEQSKALPVEVSVRQDDLNDEVAQNESEALLLEPVAGGWTQAAADATLMDRVARHAKTLMAGRGAKAIHGGAWSIGGYVATQLLRTGATLVLARRFLGPETFGVVGLVGVFLAGLTMFSELGIVANIVQHPRGDDPKFLNTAFSIQAGRGVLIWLCAAVASYPLALFYKQPELFSLLVVAALSELVRGLTSTTAWTLTRHVNLRSITLLTIGSEAIAFVVGVAWAILSPSAWALVSRTIASAAVYAVGSHFLAKPSVRFGWDKTAAKDILHFGGWISVATATYFLGGQGERLILGKLITPAELGCFSLAIMIAAVPAGGITQLVSQIFLPMISNSVRTGHQDAVRDFISSRRLFLGAAVFTAVGFVICSRPLVHFVLPPKYLMTGWMLQMLGLRVALDIFAAPTSNMILAYGRTKYSAAGNTARLVLMVSGVWVSFVMFGIREAVVALVLAQALSYFPLVFGLHKLLPEVVRTEIRNYALFLALIALGVFLSWPKAL
jgi:O-antigen/teichoic acid export membrane protein